MVFKSNYSLIFVIGFFTLLSSCDNNDTSEISSAVEVYKEPYRSKPKVEEKIVYRDFFLEQPLENGFCFGMLLSEWNKKLALFAKEGVLSGLTDKPRMFYFPMDIPVSTRVSSNNYNYYYTDDSYLGSFNSIGDKYSVLGIFTERNSELFRRNNVEINQPVLVGIKFKYFVDQSNVLTKIDNLIKDENLIYVAGSYPIINKPISPSEFGFNLKDSYAVYLGGKEKEEVCNKVNLFYSKNENVLFENEKYYAVIEVNIKTHARVIRDNNCEIYSILSGERKFYFTKTIFSKKQSRLNIEDYLTIEQKNKIKREIEYEKKKKELIKKALE